ncbi:hypothetical protein NDU88_007550 [Pleurodeles waltl]|uniref:Uncharacterized protein n=1 Tax=Pleurodeles waltl TaxID=8319 RepID=A0AAV7MHD8_PLEWA|nr:hypothetical protein NDU88_007550 [Pleurodeles waltl]
MPRPSAIDGGVPDRQLLKELISGHRAVAPVRGYLWDTNASPHCIPVASRMDRHSVSHFWGPLILTGVSSALFISAPQGSILGAVNQSVLLPVSYRMNGSLSEPLMITWKCNDSRNPIIVYKLNNVSLGEDGSPLKCDGSLFTHDTYLDRVIFYPENASLCLLRLQVNDSGVYTISFRDARQSRDITLSVSSAQEPPGNGTAEGASDGDTRNRHHLVILMGSAAGGCSALALLLVLYGVLRPRQRRIILEEQVQTQEEQLLQDGHNYQEYQLHQIDRTSQEDPPVTRIPPHFLPTIYSLVGEGQGSRLSMPEPEIVYTEVNHKLKPAFWTSTL